MELEFKACTGDACIYHRIAAGVVTLLAVYVDHTFLVACTDQDALDEFKSAVMAKFQVKDQGSLHGRQFLGLEVKFDRAAGVLQIDSL